jgi:hypothetical protein
MKSLVFRSVIRSIIACALPLSLSPGCGTCTDADVSEFAATASLRARLQAATCEGFCGTGVTTCSVVVNGQSPLAIDCNGLSPANPPTGDLSVRVEPADCGLVCDGGAETCLVNNNDYRLLGKISRTCFTSHLCARGPFTAVEGRRPAELQLGQGRADCAVGAFFAEAAQLEAASVTAFAILAEELAFHGAPAELVAAAHRAKSDEIRHTRMATALARSFAASPGEPQISRGAVRPLLAIALENAVEGCVREAYGAFMASYQGSRASDERIRKTMARIARDELRHAELAFAVAEWILPRLSGSEQAAVKLAQHQALSELRSELAQPVSLALLSTAGLPPSEASLAFLDAHAQLLA